jgi:hypothetical protein
MPTDTFNVTSAAQDGTGALTGATYPPISTFTNNDELVGGGTVFANRGFDGASTYYLDNGFLTFDTSSLPDAATITAAELEVDMISAPVNTNSLSLVGEYYAWDGSTAAADITSDEVATAFSAVPLSGIGSGTEVFTLTNVTSISKTGSTGFRLKITKRASDAAPTGHNYVSIAGYAHATAAPAILRVTYTDVSSVSFMQLLGVS